VDLKKLPIFAAEVRLLSRYRGNGHLPWIRSYMWLFRNMSQYNIQEERKKNKENEEKK
jgi:hypothetical protein